MEILEITAALSKNIILEFSKYSKKDSHDSHAKDLGSRYVWQLALIYILILAYFDPYLLSFYEGHNRQSNEVAVMIPYTDSDPGEIL